MNIEKNIQAIGTVLKFFGGSLNYTKLLKILYFINRKSLEEKGRAVIDDVYANMPNGVVLSNIYNLIKNRYADPQAQSFWNSFFLTQNIYDLRLRSDVIPDGELSRYEKRIINEMAEKYKDCSYSQMIEMHHDSTICPEWKDPKGSSCPLLEEEILSALGYSQEDINFISDDKTVFNAEESAILKVC